MGGEISDTWHVEAVGLAESCSGTAIMEVRRRSKDRLERPRTRA
jgi:hypothetical protein